MKYCLWKMCNYLGPLVNSANVTHRVLLFFVPITGCMSLLPYRTGEVRSKHHPGLQIRVAIHPVFPRIVLLFHQLSLENVNLYRDTICPIFLGENVKPEFGFLHFVVLKGSHQKCLCFLPVCGLRLRHTSNYVMRCTVCAPPSNAQRSFNVFIWNRRRDDGRGRSWSKKHASHQREKNDILFTILTGWKFMSLNGYSRSRETIFPPHAYCVRWKSLSGIG